MNKERLQAIIDRIEADPKSRCLGPKLNEISIETLAQIDSGCQLNILNARRDARIWLDLSNKQADHLLCKLRTLAEIKDFVEEYDCDGYNRDGYGRWGYDCDGYDCGGYDRGGYDRDGYDQDGLDKHNKPKVEQV